MMSQVSKTSVLQAQHLPTFQIFFTLYRICSWTARRSDQWFGLQSLDCKEIKPVNPKGNQPWIFIGSTDAETEAPVLSPSDAESWLIGKDPDAGKDWRREEKWTTEDEMVGWASLTQWTWVCANFRRLQPELVKMQSPQVYCNNVVSCISTRLIVSSANIQDMWNEKYSKC